VPKLLEAVADRSTSKDSDANSWHKTQKTGLPSLQAELSPNSRRHRRRAPTPSQRKADEHLPVVPATATQRKPHRRNSQAGRANATRDACPRKKESSALLGLLRIP